MSTTPETFTSADGTTIAFERIGDGPPVILVGGAFSHRGSAAALAAVLAPELTAVTYDRRGRGGSTNNDHDYTVQREIEDLAGLIEQVGGRPRVFGHSSGAVLGLEAAAQGLPIDRLAIYEPPYITGDTRALPGPDLADRVRALIEKDLLSEAAVLFLTEAVNVPAAMLDNMQTSPMWAELLKIAPTLPYDIILCNPGNALPADRIATITTPTLAMSGGASPPWLREGARGVADLVPGARHLVIEGQDHGFQAESLQPALLEFLIP